METYGSFYRRHKDKLFGYLMRLTGDYQLASDIMQESFTRMLEHYGPESQNVKLLFTIARNSVFDDARKKAHRKEQIGDIEEPGLDLEQQLLVREEYKQVMAAMQRLEETERDILALIVSSNLTYRDIAEVTGISEANVKVKVHRARVKIKKILTMGAKWWTIWSACSLMTRWTWPKRLNLLKLSERTKHLQMKPWAFCVRKKLSAET